MGHSGARPYVAESISNRGAKPIYYSISAYRSPIIIDFGPGRLNGNVNIKVSVSLYQSLAELFVMRV